MLMQISGAGPLDARGRRGNADRRSRLRLAAAISLGLHALLLAAFLLRFQRAPRLADATDTSGAVELVMMEQKGTGPAVVRPEPSPPVAAPTPSPQPAPPVPPPPPDAATAEEALPLPTPPIPPSASPIVPPEPPMEHAQEAPEINLGGNDSETNAIVTGPNVIPASVDAKYHNQEPDYPSDAVRHAEEGAVTLLIHVSAEGLAREVDIEQSSGFMSLDNAARGAVMGWHFLPAVRNGQAIPFEMQLRVVFHLN
ncbi:MAG TPA: energy transducer TonB [Acetobacteraceae bacterium]|jgi:protein TonB|nr:energy transducer TonB [Acetobacteraceae bacterium]